MENKWYEIWNNRKNNLDSIDMSDDCQIVIELNRIIGYDFFGKGSQIAFEEFQKKHNYLKENLQLPEGGGYGKECL